MSTMISLQTILWSALAAAAGIGLPVLVLLVWKFKFCRGAKLFPAVVGAVTFVVFAQVLEGVPKAIFFGGGTGVSQYVLTHAWAYTLIGCLLAGVFEEVGRYLAFRFLLKRYTKEVYLTYDSDGAGIKAALRAIPILKEVGITTKIINMKPYKDPDEFIKALGAEAYQERIDQAENSFLFEVRMEEQQHDMHDPEGKTAFYNAVAKMLCGFTEKLERDNYIEAVAAKYMISPDDLRRLVNQQGLKAGLAGGGRAPQSVADAQDGARTEYKKSAKKREDGMVQSQKLLLTWLTNSPALFPKVQRYVGADDFTDPICHSVAKMLFEQYEKDGTVNPARIISTYEDEEQQREAAGILNATIHRVDTREEREKALRETVIRVRENSINHKLANTFDVQEMAALAKEKNELPGTVHIPLEE